jgi:hypothetical protein
LTVNPNISTLQNLTVSGAGNTPDVVSGSESSSAANETPALWREGGHSGSLTPVKYLSLKNTSQEGGPLLTFARGLWLTETCSTRHCTPTPELTSPRSMPPDGKSLRP